MFTDLLIASILLTWLYMTVWYLLSIILKRNDIADMAWGLGFIYLTALALIMNNAPSLPAVVVLALVSIWGLRLFSHIYLRNVNKKEDFRYAKWRQDWGKWFYIRSYLQVYMLQGLLLIAVSLPAILIAGQETTFSITSWTAAGILLWIFGFLFETIGDMQLTKFIKDVGNKGKIMKYGLWKYTRHPNYFGEVVQWWAIWLILASTSLNLNTIFTGLIGPITITILIIFVSGIPLLEKKYKENKEYQEYAKLTNKFFPWEPKKSK